MSRTPEKWQLRLYIFVLLYFVDPKNGGRKRSAVPKHLREQVMAESHSSPMAGHFSGERLYKALSRH